MHALCKGTHHRPEATQSTNIPSASGYSPKSGYLARTDSLASLAASLEVGWWLLKAVVQLRLEPYCAGTVLDGLLLLLLDSSIRREARYACGVGATAGAVRGEAGVKARKGEGGREGRGTRQGTQGGGGHTHQGLDQLSLASGAKVQHDVLPLLAGVLVLQHAIGVDDDRCLPLRGPQNLL